MITSKQNKKLKELNKIIDQKCSDNSLYALEGFTIFEEAIRENVEIVDVYVSESAENEFRSRYNQLYTTVKDDILRSLSKTKTGKDIIFVVKKPSKINIKEINDELVLLLDFLQDPGNMGTIIRTADAFGIKNILTVNNCVNVYNEKVLRSTMGSIFRVNVTSIELDDLRSLIERGYKLISTSPNGEKIKKFNSKIILALGNEANGVSEEVFRESFKRVKIPMKGKTESLNVAIAAGISIYIMMEE